MGLIAQFDYLHAIAGFMVGVLVGLTGVGGGSLMTPVLVLLFGVNAKTAVGTDLLYASITKMAGSAIHGWRETVDWRIVRLLASGSLPSAAITLTVLSYIGKIGKSTEHTILLILGGMLLLTAVATAFQRKLIAFAGKHDKIDPKRAAVPTILLGAAIGALVSISSVGAGAIGVTALLMLYPTLPVSRIVGTDIAHAVPLTLLAGLGHWVIGDVNLLLLGNLLVGSIPGVIIGSLLSTRASDGFLRPALAAVLTASGLKLLLQ
ncbi:MAG: sulfite exporter TauE/SafE family protein [Novosphingobium sp.]